MVKFAGLICKCWEVRLLKTAKPIFSVEAIGFQGFRTLSTPSLAAGCDEGDDDNGLVNRCDHYTTEPAGCQGHFGGFRSRETCVAESRTDLDGRVRAGRGG